MFAPTKDSVNIRKPWNVFIVCVLFSPGSLQLIEFLKFYVTFRTTHYRLETNKIDYRLTFLIRNSCIFRARFKSRSGIRFFKHSSD